MDITDEYLKMVLALPEEFFNELTPKLGDTVIALGPDIKMIFISKSGRGLGENWNVVRYLDDDREILVSNPLRLIPRQEQLQKMMNLNPIKFIEDLFRYASEPIKKNMDISIFSVDMNCFTLAYVMDRKFSKGWDGDYWV